MHSHVQRGNEEPQIDPKTGGTINPGQFAATEPLSSETQVRKDYAVPPKWKNEITHVQEYRVKPGTQIQESIAGSQIVDGIVYPGGKNQIEILNQNGNRIQNDVLLPVGEPIPIPKD